MLSSFGVRTNFSLTKRKIMDILSVGLGTLLAGVLSMYLEKSNRRRQKRHPSGQGVLSRQKSIWLGYFVVAHLIYHSYDQFANYFSKRGIEKWEFCAFYKYFMKGFW